MKKLFNFFLVCATLAQVFAFINLVITQDLAMCFLWIAVIVGISVLEYAVLRKIHGK
jgi:hypothetical protein